jgi:hypothetical protein
MIPLEGQKNRKDSLTDLWGRSEIRDGDLHGCEPQSKYSWFSLSFRNLSFSVASPYRFVRGFEWMKATKASFESYTSQKNRKASDLQICEGGLPWHQEWWSSWMWASDGPCKTTTIAHCLLAQVVTKIEMPWSGDSWEPPRGSERLTRVPLRSQSDSQGGPDRLSGGLGRSGRLSMGPGHL